MKARHGWWWGLMLLPGFVVASGCAGDGELEALDDTGTADVSFGLELEYGVRADFPIWYDETEFHTDVRVVSQTDSTLRFEGARVYETVRADTFTNVSVSAEEFNDFGDLSTDMGFLLFTAGHDGWYGRPGEWHLATCNDSFRSIVFDGYNAAMDALVATPNGDQQKTLSFADCGIAVGDYFGVVGYPTSGWGSLEGYYHLEVDVDCDGFACRHQEAE